MLKITLAGLVLSKIITLEKAEEIYKKLSNELIPDTVTEVVEKIKEIIDEGI